jgi:uncharacterized membrane protein (DUF106 family)
MDLGYLVSAFFRLVLSVFQRHNPMWGLLPISALLGAGMLWVFGRTSNQESIRVTKNRLKACMLEMRLFTDEPRLVWDAQKGLLLANLRFLALTLRPAVFLAIPMVLLFAQLEAFYGRAPLTVGQSAIVTVQMKQDLGGDPAVPLLQSPDGIVVEGPPVRVPGERQISWRIRAVRELSGTLKFVLPAGVAEKHVEAGVGPRYVSDRSVSTLLGQLWHPGERRLSLSSVDWIEIRYPSATVAWLGLDFPWVVWFLLISMVAALLLKKRMGVAF